MTVAIRTHETENTIIEIKFTRKIYDNDICFDGWKTGTERKIYEDYAVKITSKKNGKSIWKSGKPGDFAFFDTSGKLPAGAYARLSDAYISQNVYEICMAMMAELDAELTKSEEFTALELAEAVKKETHAKAQAAHDAWYNSDEQKNYRRFTREMEREDSDY